MERGSKLHYTRYSGALGPDLNIDIERTEQKIIADTPVRFSIGLLFVKDVMRILAPPLSSGGSRLDAFLILVIVP